MKKVLTIIAGALLATSAFAQVEVENYDALRTNTWSPYVKGGVALTTGGDFHNNNAGVGTFVSPMAGAGIDYNILPWVRVGVGYEAAGYNREQRLTAIALDGTSYRSLEMIYHAVDLTADFNLMEICKDRKCKAFNLYLGTGFGYLMSQGIAKNVSMGFEETQDPNNIVNGVKVADNYNLHAWYHSTNTAVAFNSPYVPVYLSAEYDICPRFTIGLEGGVKYLLSKDTYAPQFIETAGIVLRWNILGLKQGCRTKAQVINELRTKLNACTAANADCSARAAKLASDNADLEKQISDVRKKLAESEANCEALRKQLEEAYKAARDKELSEVLAKAVVYFANDSYKISADAQKTIDTVSEFLKKYDDVKVSLVGSASKTGPKAHNQQLSENRCNAVKEALVAAGVAESQIEGIKAVGDQGMTSKKECRRVVFTLE